MFTGKLFGIHKMVSFQYLACTDKNCVIIYDNTCPLYLKQREKQIQIRYDNLPDYPCYLDDYLAEIYKAEDELRENMETLQCNNKTITEIFESGSPEYNYYHKMINKMH